MGGGGLCLPPHLSADPNFYDAIFCRYFNFFFQNIKIWAFINKIASASGGLPSPRPAGPLLSHILNTPLDVYRTTDTGLSKVNMWVKQEVNDTIKASDDNDDLYRGISPRYYFF